MRRRRGRENGVVTAIYGNMTPFSRPCRRRVVFAIFLYYRTLTTLTYITTKCNTLLPRVTTSSHSGPLNIFMWLPHIATPRVITDFTPFR